MKTLSEIDSAAKQLALSRDLLAELVRNLNDGIETIKRRCLPTIKRAVNNCAAEHANLKAAIEESPGLFEKPRTHNLHGIKCGYAKGTGAVTIDDAENTVALIRKHFLDQFDVLVKTKETPRKKVLAEQLTVAELKKIGCTVDETGDHVVIKFTDSAVDKAVAALLKDATEDATESQAA